MRACEQSRMGQKRGLIQDYGHCPTLTEGMMDRSMRDKDQTSPYRDVDHMLKWVLLFLVDVRMIATCINTLLHDVPHRIKEKGSLPCLLPV
jgi:hypothetical protein